MALKLKLNELVLFEEQAGAPFMQVAKLFEPSFCKPHRLAQGACSECRAKKGVCKAHQEQYRECEECQGSRAPMKAWAALGWVLKRRREPGLDWDTYIESADLDEVMAEVEAIGGNG